MAVVLLLVAIVVATQQDDEDPVAQPSSTQAPSTEPAPSATSVAGTSTAAPPTTQKATPLAIVAADDRRIVVLEQGGSAPPRTLFDLGPSTSADEAPPLIGGVALSGDGQQVYFDVAGTPVVGALQKVPVAGGPAQQIGPGASPAPSPDGTMLASVQALLPDEPASLILRPLAGGSERRIDLGDETCGNIAWSPNSREIAVDICSGGEAVTVALVDVPTGGVRLLAPPESVTWSVPAYKPDGTLTLVEQREPDAVVVALAPDRARVTASILRRSSTTITAIDWSGTGDLLVCDADGIVLSAVGGGRAQQVATGYTSAAW